MLFRVMAWLHRDLQDNPTFCSIPLPWCAESIDLIYIICRNLQDLAASLFSFSIVPYAGFLYCLQRSKKTPPLAMFGFYFLLVFVFGTIPAGIYGASASAPSDFWSCWFAQSNLCHRKRRIGACFKGSHFEGRVNLQRTMSNQRPLSALQPRRTTIPHWRMSTGCMVQRSRC